MPKMLLQLEVALAPVVLIGCARGDPEWDLRGGVELVMKTISGLAQEDAQRRMLFLHKIECRAKPGHSETPADTNEVNNVAFDDVLDM